MAGYIGYKRTITLDFNYDQVKQGVPKVNQQMALMNSEFNKAMASINKSGSAIDKLTVQNQKYAAQVQIQKEKVAGLEKELEKLSTAENKNQRAITSKQIELNNAKAKLTDYQMALNRSNNELAKSNTLFGTAKLAIEDFKMGAERAGVDLNALGKEIAAVTAAVTAFGTVTGKAFMDYEGDITQARNLMDESVMSFEELDKGVRGIADSYGLEAAAAARAAEAALSSNVQTADSLDFLSKSAKFAVATTSELSEANERMLTATDMGTSIMNAYKLSIDDMNGVFDQLILTQKMAKVTWEDYNSQIGNLVALGGQWNVSLKEINASLIMQTRCGIDSATALTNTKAILSGIVSPSAQASEAAKKLGIDFSKSALESKGFARILMEVITATQKDSEAATQLFGNIRGLSGVTVNAAENGRLYKEVMEELDGAVGSLDQSFQNVTETTNYKFDSAINNLKNSFVSMGETISPFIEGVAKVVEVISKLPAPITVGVVSLASLCVAVNAGKKVFDVFSNTAGILGVVFTKIASLIGINTASFAANTISVGANTTAMAGQSTAAGTATAALSAEASAAGAASAANSALTGTTAGATAGLSGVGAAGTVAGSGLMATGVGGTMALGPILLVIAAVAALVTLLVLLGNKSKSAKQELANVGQTAQSVASDVTNSAKSAEKEVNRTMKTVAKGSTVATWSSDRRGYASGTNYVKEDGYYTINEGNETETFLRRGTQVRNASRTARESKGTDMSKTNSLLESLISEVNNMKSTISNLPSEQLRLARM